jgi:hypothetical protein
MPWVESISVATASSSSGFQKLGQPLPESNLVCEPNSSAPQHTQR